MLVFTEHALHIMWRHGRSLGSELKLSFVLQTAHDSAFSTAREEEEFVSSLGALTHSLSSSILSDTEKQNLRKNKPPPTRSYSQTAPATVDRCKVMSSHLRS